MAKKHHEEFRFYDGSDRFRQPPKRTGLPIYDSFPEFVLDNWSAETIAAGKMIHKNRYDYDNGQKGNGGFYSDRMRQWDEEKYNRAVQKLSAGWHNSTPESFSAMLTDYLGKPTTLTQLIRMDDGRGFDLYYLAFIN